MCKIFLSQIIVRPAELINFKFNQCDLKPEQDFQKE